MGGKWKLLRAFFFTGMLVSGGVLGVAFPQPPPPVIINEIDYDQPGEPDGSAE